MADNQEEKEPEYQLEFYVNEAIRRQKEELPEWAKSLFKTIFNAAAVAFNAVWSNIIVIIAGKLKDFFLWFYPQVEKAENEFWRAALKTLESGGLINPQIAESLLRLENIPAPLGSIINIALLLSFLKEYIGTLSNVMYAPLSWKLNQEYRPNLGPAQTLVQAAFIAPELTDKIRETLAKQGYSEEQIDLLFISAYRLYDVDTIRDLYLRGAIDESKMKERMQELGFTEERIAEIKKTWEIIPGPQDLLTMVAHEAFEPDMIERYGLGSEFPEEQSKYLAAQGLTREWQERYWISHWVHPSMGQIMEMLHRQVMKPDGKPFSMEDVYEYFRLIEIPPYWRDMLRDISYIPYTRVDTRRMHELGVLSDEELVKAYMDQGYDREHAEKMAEFTIRYNSDARSKLTQSQIIKAYRDSMLSRDEAKNLLKSIKLSDDIAEWNLLYADFEEQLEIQELYIAAAQERFVDNLWDETETRAALMKLNLPGARIDALIEKWSTKRIADRKLPSKTDLDKFLRNGIIDKDTYRIEMYKLGYSFAYTDWYIRLVELKKAG